MAGLLDAMNTYEGQQGLGLLAAAGPRFDGAGFFQRLQEGMGSADKWKRDQSRAELEKMQMDEYKQKMLESAQEREKKAQLLKLVEQYRTPAIAQGQLGSGPTNLVNDALPSDLQIGAQSQLAPRPAGFDRQGFGQAYEGIDPIAGFNYLKGIEKDKGEAFTLSADQVRYGPDGKVVARGMSKPAEEDQFTKNLRMAGIDPSSPQGRAAYAAMISKQTTHAPAPSATVINKQEGEESKTVGKFFGDAYANVQTAGMSAQGKINRISRLSQLLDGVETGKFAPLGVEVAKGAKALGFNIDDKLQNKEAAIALSSEMALELRNPAGGAGMPGAMSDADRNFLAGMVPGIEKTPEGRKLISETYRKLAQRDIEVAKMARAYRTKNKSINEGFYDELARYAESNPLFTSTGQGDLRSRADAILKGK